MPLNAGSSLETKGKNASQDNGRHRLQIDFTPEAFESLMEIRSKSGARTSAEVIRNALRLYEWFIELKDRNAKLQIAVDDSTKEVEVLF